MARAIASVLAVFALVGSACGSNTGNMGTPGADMFEWTEGGQTMTATTARFSVGATMTGSAFTIALEGIAPTGVTCFLSGQFADVVPPPAGSYPIVLLLDGSNTAPQPDRSFTGMCQPSTMVAGGFVLDPSVGGQVVLSRSNTDSIEGTFTMEASTMPPANASPTTSFTGKFKVGCQPSAGAPCGPLSTATVGTCADLLACCAAADPTNQAGCMFERDSAAPGGDVACGRKLATIQDLYCP